MRIKWLGLVQAVTLLGAIACAFPAFWGITEITRFNGWDLAALILFLGFLVSCYTEQKDH